MWGEVRPRSIPHHTLREVRLQHNRDGDRHRIAAFKPQDILQSPPSPTADLHQILMLVMRIEPSSGLGSAKQTMRLKRAMFSTRGGDPED